MDTRSLEEIFEEFIRKEKEKGGCPCSKGRG